MNQKFNVTGMTCSACSASVERNVKKLDGIQSVNVNLLTNSMIVEYDDAITDNHTIVEIVADAGYGASVFVRGADKNAKTEKNVSPMEDQVKEMKYRLIVSFAFLIPLLYLAMHHMLNEWIGLPIPSFIKAAFHANFFSLGIREYAIIPLGSLCDTILACFAESCGFSIFQKH